MSGSPWLRHCGVGKTRSREVESILLWCECQVADAKTLREKVENWPESRLEGGPPTTEGEDSNRMLAYSMMMLEHRIGNFRRKSGDPLRW